MNTDSYRYRLGQIGVFFLHARRRRPRRAAAGTTPRRVHYLACERARRHRRGHGSLQRCAPLGASLRRTRTAATIDGRADLQTVSQEPGREERPQRRRGDRHRGAAGQHALCACEVAGSAGAWSSSPRQHRNKCGSATSPRDCRSARCWSPSPTNTRARPGRCWRAMKTTTPRPGSSTRWCSARRARAVKQRPCPDETRFNASANEVGNRSDRPEESLTNFSAPSTGCG